MKKRYRTIIFDDGLVERELSTYLNNNHIKKEDIISISFSSNYYRDFKHQSPNQILLVYLEEE